ncbi:MAG: hypothetical protein ACTHK1_07350 [Actinomycetales bacterium]
MPSSGHAPLARRTGKATASTPPAAAAHTAAAHTAAAHTAAAHSPEASLTSGSASAAGLLALQRSAGNRAVSQVVTSSAPAVRRLSIGTQEFDAAGKTKDKGLAAIRKALAALVKAKPEQREVALRQLDAACTSWLNGPGRGDASAHRALVMQLADEIPVELAQLSKGQAQDVYLSNMKATVEGASDPHALKALKHLNGASKKTKEIGESMGMTAAESAAVNTFTGADYTYINPATANSASWMGAQKAKPELGLTDIDDRDLREEGALHAGVAMQGLSKLPPWTQDTYRGARYTEDEFKKQFGVGAVMSFDSFASSAQEEKVALNFAHGIGIEYKIDASKDIAVVAVLSNTNGRDISEISAVKKEKEVLLLPGSRFVVKSVKEIDGNAAYPDLVKLAAQMNQPVPRKWYVAQLDYAPKDAKPARPTSPAPGGAPARPALQAPGDMPPLPAVPAQGGSTWKSATPSGTKPAKPAKPAGSTWKKAVPSSWR